MGNGISLEENENGNEEYSRENNIEMKITSSSNENGENGENGENLSSNSTIKRIKKTSSDVSKKRRSTFKNGNSNSNSNSNNNASAYKKTKSRRR